MAPIIPFLGTFSLHWCSLMYIQALATAYLLSLWRIRRGEMRCPPDSSALQDLIAASILKIMLGRCLGNFVNGELHGRDDSFPSREAVEDLERTGAAVPWWRGT